MPLMLYDKAAGDIDYAAFNDDGVMTRNRTINGVRKTWDIIRPGTFTNGKIWTYLFYDRNAGQGAIVGLDLFDGTINLDRTSSGWRKSWDMIAAGSFRGWAETEALLYDRMAGEADLVAFDSKGVMKLDRTHSGWYKSWSTILPTYLFPNHGQVALCYDSNTGTANVVGFDNGGAMRFVYGAELPKDCDDVVTGRFIGNDRAQLLLYNRKAGEATVVGFDDRGRVNLQRTDKSWRKTWNIVRMAHLPRSTTTNSVLLYDREAGEAAVVGFDENGNKSFDVTNRGWRKTGDVMVVATFLEEGFHSIVLYDRAGGQADFIAFNSEGTVRLKHTNRNWRKTWTVLEPLLKVN